VEIVAVRMDSGLAELFGLAVPQQSETRADLHSGLSLPDRVDGLRDPADVPLSRPATTGDEADPLRARPRGLIGDPCGLRRVDPRVLQDLRVGAEPLRAVRAALRAQPAFH